MTNDIAINGYGRIGPNVPCAFMKPGRVHDIEIVAINDLGDAETNARLYDTAHERCAGSVAVDDDQLVANGDRLEVFADRNPSVVPRGPLRVDFVLDARADTLATRLYRAHLAGGAKKVAISAPSDKAVDATIVYAASTACSTQANTAAEGNGCAIDCQSTQNRTFNRGCTI
jgi:glyceraldehyde 3-phosphate dehydrogenase (phosphorylating)